MKADLHVHSIYSDGVALPHQIVDLAHKANIEVMALSDHDTMEGVNEATRRCAKYGMINIPAIELSAFDGRDIHILGYGVNQEDRVFKMWLEIIAGYRHKRNLDIIDRLNKAGYDIAYEDILEFGLGTMGRIHMSKALVKKGYFSHFNDAFKLTSRGGPCHIIHYELSPKIAIEIITNAGGKAVLAHPELIGLDESDKDGFVRQLKDYGLCGIETHYRKHTKEAEAFWQSLAQKYDLFDSIGGDNHSLTTHDFMNMEASEELRRGLGF